MKHRQLEFLFLNVGHFFDHLIILIFSAVAALALTREWGMGYAQLIPYATPGFVAFGLFAVPAGWLSASSGLCALQCHDHYFTF